ncbi:hypothetical protein DACRYDRAFT_107058 [Dacryopinax primogenitus]|uniref:Uncharacterized protein n=1 Tax=Dacryopinax primogenitus (strain DJM 731) TaxID=1858805 RepID=M5GD28_DACPD|nr:uncharacterized protein DACRYDRAFT_107058 [Dacryopinax primogenitus]EJU02113.1 hypothetical protein DACRYDRAFT_107058 [Dacryopinax primogenitus]
MPPSNAFSDANKSSILAWVEICHENPGFHHPPVPQGLDEATSELTQPWHCPTTIIRSEFDDQFWGGAHVLRRGFELQNEPILVGYTPAVPSYLVLFYVSDCHLASIEDGSEGSDDVQLQYPFRLLPCILPSSEKELPDIGWSMDHLGRINTASGPISSDVS